jgi:UDPglucose 6-dehydrogenase
MKLAVIGSGYVGLVTGAGFSDFGNHVTCVDIDQARIDRLRQGEIPFHEPGLSDLVQRNARAGRLVFTTDTVEAVRGVDVVFLAVGTPSLPDGAADLSFLLEAARQVGRGLTANTVVVTKSTVPVGTGDLVRETVASVTAQPFSVASNPEFLKEGDAVNDFMKPARVIVGADDAHAIDVLRRLYGGFLRTNDRVSVMDLRSAELTKYAANAMLATRISFMNELAALAEALGADIEKVRKGVGSDPRIGAKFLFPGVGFGGSCFPKDLRALRDMGRGSGVRLGIVEAVVDANA